MPITFLQEKQSVSNTLGRTDGATANTVRDNAINEVRYEIANTYPFSWLETPTTVVTDANGQVDLPADFNIVHKPKDVRIGSEVLVHIDKQQSDDVSIPWYFVDYNSSTSKWRLNTNQASSSVDIIYYQIPAELTTDAQVDIIPDLTIIKYLAAARYWLGSERDETNHDRFETLGQQRLRVMINIDKRSNVTRLNRGSIWTNNLGFNVGD
jgi:hypothetical protein